MKKTSSPWRIITCIGVVCLSLTTAFAQNLLLNPSFQSGPPDTSWEWLGGAESWSVSASHAGSTPDFSNKVLALSLNLTPPLPPVIGVVQTLHTTGGDSWTFTGYAKQTDWGLGADCYGILKMEFVGSSGTSYSTTVDPHTSTGWVPFTLTGTAPSGATDVRFSATVFQGEASGGVLFFDAFSATVVSAVPEPGTLLGVVGILASAIALRTWKSRCGSKRF